MQKTQNYNLNKPEVTDPLRVADFNENADILDVALNSLNTAVGSKAEKSAVTAVETALVNYKTSNNAAMANKADVSALAALSAALGSGGSNCRIAMGSYVGDDTFGSAAPTSLSFPFKPLWVIIANVTNETTSSPTDMQHCLLVNPLRGGSSTNGSNLRVTWTDTSVSWYCKTAEGSGENQNNDSGTTYVWVAVGIG